VFADTTVRVLPVLFTGAGGCAAYRPSEEALGVIPVALGAIPVVDADRLAILLDLLESGHEERLLGFLENALLNELARPSLDTA